MVLPLCDLRQLPLGALRLKIQPEEKPHWGRRRSVWQTPKLGLEMLCEWRHMAEHPRLGLGHCLRVRIQPGPGPSLCPVTLPVVTAEGSATDLTRHLREVKQSSPYNYYSGQQGARYTGAEVKMDRVRLGETLSPTVPLRKLLKA